MKAFQASPMPSGQDVARNYRELASRCREMANRCRRPAPLLLRAAVFDEAAEYQLQHGRNGEQVIDRWQILMGRRRRRASGHLAR